MDAPRLIGSAGPDNLVDYDGSIWRVPQALGPTDLQDAAQRARQGVRPFPTRELAEAAPASPSPATTVPSGGRVFDVTWWEATGRYTEFDRNGISSPIKRRMDTGDERPSYDLPPGACWEAKDIGEYVYPKAADGKAVFCRVPDRDGYHDWLIDGRASNCTMKDDKVHHCWVRHGTVGERITVDKNGLTCQAGGGSISCDGFHGMLTAGQLREC